MEGPNSCIASEKNSHLIREVKKFPSLYDTSDSNYYVLAERNKAWLQVAVNCNEPAEFCHLRWKSLRKRYAKERRRIPEILQGKRRPWALFPKMAFLASSTIKGRGARKQLKSAPNSLRNTPPVKQHNSDDDMLILGDNDEIVTTCKSVVSEEGEDEYIYETLDDPDSALEMMKDSPLPTVKPMAIRSGTSPNMPAMVRIRGSGRIRKVTPKMQNSFIAKKLKQAQQVIQQSNVSNNNTEIKVPTSTSENKTGPTITTNTRPTFHNGKVVAYQDKTRYIATVNPNIIRVGKVTETDHSAQTRDSTVLTDNKTTASDVSDGPGEKPKTQFKVVKLKGRNPIIFPPNELPNFQSLLKAERSPTKEQSEVKSPLIKVKSVDNLNQSTSRNENGESNNLDIIHSVGLVRKSTAEKTSESEKIPNQSYSRAYSWNRPAALRVFKRLTAENVVHPDSQTNDYEIEESWNDNIKEEIEDTRSPSSWSQYPPIPEVVMNCPESPNTSNKLIEAKLQLVELQRKLLDDQHKKTMEYMKKEHDLKMTLLKSELDMKRKQFSLIM